MSIYKGNNLIAGGSINTPEYIRNQNILSDWESITISTNNESPTVMPYDGFIIFDSNTLAYVYVNKAVYRVNNTTGTSPVKKGDKVSVAFNGSDSSLSAHARFYKLRDYSGR